MLTHVVLFKLSEPFPENAEKVAGWLRGMEGQVAGLASITVGIDVDRGPRAYEVCLITTHEDADALATYQADPRHGEVKALLAPLAVHTAVVDFEA